MHPIARGQFCAFPQRDGPLQDHQVSGSVCMPMREDFGIRLPLGEEHVTAFVGRKGQLPFGKALGHIAGRENLPEFLGRGVAGRKECRVGI